MQQQQPSMSVHQLCKLLDVNRRWYYKCRKQHKRAEADEKLREAIEQIVLEFAGYGYRPRHPGPGAGRLEGQS